MEATAPTTDRPRRSLVEMLTKVQSLTISTVLHAVLVLMLGTTVLFKKMSEPPDFAAEPGGLVSANEAMQQPPEQPPQMQQPEFSQTTPNVSQMPSSPSQMAAITTNNVTTPSFNMASLAVASPTMRSTDTKIPPTTVAMTTGTGKQLSKDIAGKIANFTAGWAKGGTASFSQPLRQREFEFTAYLAKYEGGDWDSTVRLEDGVIWKGSLPNLLYIITKLSKKKIHAEPQAVPLNLASGEIFEKKPPFIFFTGHRDFKLTDKEVEVLGEYLRRGGCIWGDSSLPGQRSRFDIAFRREMLRLVPDPNQPWAPLPPNHPIFTKAYYSEVRAVPPGINFYDEPIYSLVGYGGEIAILYTANDYGDMWQFGIDEKGKMDMSVDERRRYTAIEWDMWVRRNIYFRNIEEKSLMDTYKFGTNVIIHLVTRWEDKIRNVPIMNNTAPGMGAPK
jgi:hypothetical protein